MKFTSEDLMKAMGLSVGDRVKINDYEHIFEVVKEERGITLQHIEQRYYSNIANLIDQDFEILPRPKLVGDLECNHDCGNCPLRILPSCKGCGIKTLYKILEAYKMISKDEDFFDKEIYDLLKSRLDKEVE